MGFEAEHYAGGMHLYAASLDEHDGLMKYEGTLLHVPEDLSDYQ